MQTPPPPPSVPPMPNQQPQGYQTLPPPPKGKFPVWAIVMLSCGGCAILGVVILAAVMFPVFAHAREKARQVSCLTNMKQMSTGLLMYQQDYDERMPPAKMWMDNLVPYIKDEKAFHCSSVPTGDSQNHGYGFNSTLSQLSMEQAMNKNLVFAATPMLFESSKLGRNEYDALASVVNPPRHVRGDGNNFAYLDGHAKYKRGTEALTGEGETDYAGFGSFPAPGNGNP